ncbi:MAG: TRAP transporter small permease [Clostridiales bacterium]|nr:TRAP transporter small permease [Clostridiales bacterium]MCF8022045.1 TRAP transporter small permease [Clostridiales bacterium]
MLSTLNKVTDKINQVCKVLVTTFIIVLIVSMTVQVILRYVFDFALSWADGLARYMLVWTSFLGAAVAVKSRSHIALTFVRDRFPARTKNIFILLSRLCFMTLIIVVFVSGIKTVKLVIPQISSAIPMSMAWFYAAVPVSALVIFLNLINDIAYIIKEIISKNNNLEGN